MKANSTNLILKFFVVITVLAIASCSSNDEPDSVDDNPFVPIELSVEEAKTSESLNGFALSLLKTTVTSNDEGENTAVSPIGAAMVAGMFGNAIDRTDIDQLLSTLGVSPMASLNAYCKKMLSSLPTQDYSSQFILSNVAWFNQEKVALDESYKKVLTDDYNSEIKHCDFNNLSIVSEINEWIKNKTQGSIPKIIKSISPNELAVWINTIYFKGLWKAPFDKAKTSSEEFTKENGQKVNILMMSNPEINQGVRVYDKVDELRPELYKVRLEYAELTYGNGAFAMTAIMPSENQTIESFLESLSEQNLENIFTGKNLFGRLEVSPVSFPKLNLSVSTNLVPPMISLGLKNVFRSVKMPGIGNDNGMVSQFRQELRVDIDENGSKLAAVTFTGLFTDIGHGKPIVFNRPFVYFVWEKSTRVILLAGTVMDPTK